MPGRSFLTVFVVATLLAVYTRTFVVQAFRIPSDSMAPTLIEGDHILVNRFIYAGAHRPGGALFRFLPTRDLRRGDVAVFRSPPGPIVIKRCLGLPGETVEVESHRLRIDGVHLAERGYLGHGNLEAWLQSATSSSEISSFGPFKIPERHYFCLGDHREHSRDSRSWGSIPVRTLEGRAVMIYWSVRSAKDPDDEVFSWDKIPARWWSRIRWERSFDLVR